MISDLTNGPAESALAMGRRFGKTGLVLGILRGYTIDRAALHRLVQRELKKIKRHQPR